MSDCTERPSVNSQNEGISSQVEATILRRNLLAEEEARRNLAELRRNLLVFSQPEGHSLMIPPSKSHTTLALAETLPQSCFWGWRGISVVLYSSRFPVTKPQVHMFRKALESLWHFSMLKNLIASWV